MWQMRTVVIPVVVGALGVKKGTKKQLRKTPSNKQPGLNPENITLVALYSE